MAKGESPEIAERWQSKVLGWGMVDPAQLLAHPLNWREHPAAQREALRGSLNELGIITPVVVNRLTGHVLDGHARIEEYITAEISEVPVAYVEVDPAKESLALLSLDPIAAMAEANSQRLDALLREAKTGEAALQVLLTDLAKDAGLELGKPPPAVPGIVIQYGLVFDSEAQQETWFRFLKYLKQEYPSLETIAERLTTFLETRVFDGEV